MRISIAWKNVMHDKRRTLAAMSGVVFAIVLVFMQLGFYAACRSSSIKVYEAMDFDAILLSPAYVHLRCCYPIPRARLDEASTVAGVVSATPVYITAGLWRNTEISAQRELLVLGVNPEQRPFRDPRIASGLHLLTEPDTAIMDQIARPLVGPHPVGAVTEVNGRRISVVADYSQGTGFVADGTIIVSDLTFWQLTPFRSLRRASLGLLRFDPQADSDEVLRQLRQRLPNDTLVWSRDEMQAYEQHFFTLVKPVGLMFTFGIFVGFAVGAVILYQILAADISNQIPQYATLKAMGYGPSYLFGVVMKQGMWFGVLAYGPALLISVAVYAIVRQVSLLPMELTIERCGLVFLASVGMCGLSGVLAVLKVNRADPADLF